MAPESYNVSVPGSMMLMGEHAVLHGKQALVCAVNQRLRVQLTPVNTNVITITDSRLGTLVTTVNAVHMQNPFKFVTAAILLFKSQLSTGFTLDINSDFSSTIGLGSSAAVTVATIAALGQWLNVIPLPADDILDMALQVILAVQGSGSGADVAASIYGGVLGYSVSREDDANYKVCRTGDAEVGGTARRAQRSEHDGGCRSGRTRRHINLLPTIPNLTAVYSGYKTPTPEVIRIVTAAQQQDPDRFSTIFSKIHDVAMQAVNAITERNWPLLGQLFNQHQTLQAELGVSDQTLDHLVQLLTKQPQIHGAKISGAGLGDCVIGLGEVQENLIAANDGMLQFAVRIDPEGIKYASN
ncbi:MAG TPA: hypothetical protein VLG38_05340 [Gammaproteobacteria bacterium]|nr:hypothetical protein [Gammaproteobacteria bacterium]